jgi:EAL domain-containing protein (putative c-di-GMP-specific phosphodiesterase class I)
MSNAMQVLPLNEPKGRVLLVDDDERVLSSYARILQRAGFIVEQIADGQAAHVALATQHFDLVVSDVGLSGMNGVDVLRCARGRDADLPVVLMTGSAELTSAVGAIEHGALRYLIKPIDPAVLCKTAEDAVRLRRAAAAKRRAFEVYSARGKAAQTSELASCFDQALQSLNMAFQPIVQCSERRVFAYEALVRTREPSLPRPDQLFAAAEQLGRLLDLGRIIRARVAGAMSGSSRPGCVFVNLHPLDLMDDELLSPDSPLSRFASSIVLEVTERASLGCVDELRARLATLRRLGFRLAIDDLGAGYSGLASFAQVEPEVVKLDMSLVRDVDRMPMKQKLVRSMVTLCSDMGMQVVAEGVETAGERDELVKAGCNLFQGYLFAKPGPPFPAPRF